MTNQKVKKPSAKENQIAKQEAIKWAEYIIENKDRVILLDCETTGVDESAEILQLALLNFAGLPLLDMILKPQTATRTDDFKEAYAVHGISYESTKFSPTFVEVAPMISRLLENKIVVIYNKAFDDRMLEQEFARTGVAKPDYQSECAMMEYAKYKGQWNSKFGNYRWHKLPLSIRSASAHNAQQDCVSCRDLILKMAGISIQEEIDLDF